MPNLGTTNLHFLFYGGKKRLKIESSFFYKNCPTELVPWEKCVNLLETYFIWTGMIFVMFSFFRMKKCMNLQSVTNISPPAAVSKFTVRHKKAK